MAAQQTLFFGRFRLQPEARMLYEGERRLRLGSRALEILLALIERAEGVVSKEELLARVWPGLHVDEAALRVHISALRKALGDDPAAPLYVLNVAGRGYRFVAPITRAAEDSASDDLPVTMPRPAVHPIGREATIYGLITSLQQSGFVTITGPGGIGKTTVALGVAASLAGSYSDGQTFVDLAALADPRLLPSALASAFRLRPSSGDPTADLIAWVRNRQMLLVLDNCEHLVEAAAVLGEQIRAAAPKVHLLTTSREPLRAVGEWVTRLPPLGLPPRSDGAGLKDALESPAVQLFVERARAADDGFALNDDNTASVIDICYRLDGIPLAIEFAAARVGAIGTKELLARLDDRFALLRTGRRTALARHQTLRATLDWSHQLLSKEERILFRRLAAFRGSFTFDAVQAVVDATGESAAHLLDGIANLVAKSLLNASSEGGTTLYRMLETIRAYAATKLAECDEAGFIARRHAIFYSKFLEHDEIIQSIYGEHDLSGYTAHLGNVRAALEWALSDRGDVAVGIELAAWAAPLFIGLSLLEECKGWCERALAVLDDANRGSTQEMILQEALALSSMFTMGHGDQVRAAIERGLALAEVFQDHARQLRLLFGLNYFLMRLGDIRGALAVAEQGGVIARAAKHPAGTVWAECRVGSAHHFLGNQAAAQLHCERGMALAVELGTFNANFFGFDQRIRSLAVLFRALWLRGFPDQALRIAQRAIDEATSQDHPVPICVSLVFTSMLLLQTGNSLRASDLIERLIVHAGRYSLKPYRALGIALKGELAITRNEPEAGLDLLRSALETLRAQQYNLLTPGIIGALAEGLRKMAQFEEALFTIDRALTHATNSGVELDLSELLRIRSQVLVARHDRESAMTCLTKALAVAREQSALSLELRSTMVLARLLSEGGQRDQARRTLVLVYDRFTEGFETADLKLAHTLLGDLR